MAQNEMRAMRGMPLRVRSMEGLGAAERCRAMAVNEATSCGNSRSWSSGFTSQSVPLGWCKTNAGSLPASLRDGQPAPSVRARPGVASGADCASWLLELYVLRGDGARRDDRRQRSVCVFERRASNAQPSNRWVRGGAGARWLESSNQPLT